MHGSHNRWFWLTVAAVCGAISLAALAHPGAHAADPTPTILAVANGITSTDVAVNTNTGQVFAAFQMNNRVEVMRTDSRGVEERRWWFRPGGDTTDIAVSPRTEETVLSVDDELLVVKRFDRDGDRNAFWETGFNGLTTDLTLHEITREINATMVVPSDTVTNEIDVVMMTSDGVLEDARSSGLVGTFGTLALAARRETYLGVTPPDGSVTPGTAARFDDAGEMGGQWDLPEEPVGMAAGIFDDLFVVTRTDAEHSGSVYRYMDDGRLISDWQLGAPPTDVAVDSEGMVYVGTLRWGGRMMAVTKFTPNGEERGHWMALSRLHLPVVNKAP